MAPQVVTGLQGGPPSTDALEEAVSLAHHHDGITGTAKQHPCFHIIHPLQNAH